MSYIIPATGQPLYFDLTVSEMHQGDLVITEKPVERGANIADHARKSLDKLTIVVFVTSAPHEDRDDGSRGERQTTVHLDVPTYSPPFTPTPGAVFAAIGDAIKNAFGSPAPSTQTVVTYAKEFDAREDAEKALRKLQDDATLCQVVTSFRSYTSMLLESFEMPVDEDSGQGCAEITLNFKQVRIIDTKLVNAPVVAQPRGQKDKPKGHKDPIPPAPQKQSVALALAAANGVAPPAGAP